MADLRVFKNKNGDWVGYDTHIAEVRKDLAERGITDPTTQLGDLRYAYNDWNIPGSGAIQDALYRTTGGRDSFGASKYDKDIDFNRAVNDAAYIQDYRARHQSGLAQLGAGIGKGILLAGTTFIDGTVGLVYGLGQGIYNAIDQRDASQLAIGLFNNDVSNALHGINEQMEEWLPNYYTIEEMKNRERGDWYKNLGTMNFWADTFLKNLGFTVGAFYSGGIWNKGLKVIGALKSGTAAAVVGSFLSGLNEGRIEANNTYHDILSLSTTQINDMHDKRRAEIYDEVEQEYGLDNSLGQQVLARRMQELDESTQGLLEQAERNAQRTGLVDMAVNTLFLPADNYYMYGKLYSRGFQSARRAAAAGTGFRKILSQASKMADRNVANDLAEGITREGNRYYWNGAKSVPEKLLEGSKKGLVEGWEEMWQQWASTGSGELYLPPGDSVDAYYKAMIDGDSQVATNSFWQAAAKGAIETFGDKAQYEQFLVGALTGLIGMPTFGRANNSGNDTWLGKNKWIGLSGGLGAAFSSNGDINERGQEAVDAMNAFMEKVDDQKRRMAMSTHFGDAMDGWVARNNKFEYESAADNDLANAFARFYSVGREADLLDIVNQDYDALSNEEIAKAARYFDNDPDAEINKGGQWRDRSGRLPDADNNEAINDIRQKLKEKRDRTLEHLDKYRESLDWVRSLGIQSMPPDQEEELAWLKWKVDSAFPARYKDLVKENRSIWDATRKNIKDIATDLGVSLMGSGHARQVEREVNGEKRIITEVVGDSSFVITYDKDGNPVAHAASNGTPGAISKEQMQFILNLADSADDLFSNLLEGDNMFGMASALTSLSGQQFMDIMSDKAFWKTFGNGLNYSDADFAKSMESLRDAMKVADAARQFSEQLTKFVADPFAITRNRDRIDKQARKEAKVKAGKKANAMLDKITASDIVKDYDKHALDRGAISSMLRQKDISDENKEKLQEARRIIDARREALSRIDRNTSLDNASFARAAAAVVDNATKAATSLASMRDYSSAAYSRESVAALSEVQEYLSQFDEADRDYALDDLMDAVKESVDRAMEKVYAADELHDHTRHLGGIDTKGTPATTSDPVPPLPDDAGRSSDDLTPSDEAIKEEAERIAERGKADAASNDHEVSKRDDVSQGLPAVPGPAATEPDASTGNSEASEWQRLASLQDPSRDDDPPTPTVMETEVDRETSAIEKADLNSGTPVEGADRTDKTDKGYWKSNTTEFSIHTSGRGNRAYHDVMPATSENEKLRRTKYSIIHSFLNDVRVQVFARINNNEIKPGQRVRFAFSRRLTAELEEVDPGGRNLVLLAIDDNGNILCDIASAIDGKLQRTFPGLREFYNKAVAIYGKDAENMPDGEDLFVIKDEAHPDGYESRIRDMYVGRPKFAPRGKHISPNKVFEGKEGGFLLGVATKDKVTGKTIIHTGNKAVTVMTPWSATGVAVPLPGKPFLLVETSDPNRRYVPTPVGMDTFNPKSGAKLNSFVRNAVENLVKVLDANDHLDLKDDDQTKQWSEAIVKAKDRLCKYIYPDGFLVYKHGEHGVCIVANGRKTFLDDRNVDDIMHALRDSPYQVSKDLINTVQVLGGQEINYNEALGELMTTCLEEGATHTVNDFFTIDPLDAEGNRVEADKVTPNDRFASMNTANTAPSAQETRQRTRERGGQRTRTETRTEPRLDPIDGKEVTLEPNIIVKPAKDSQGEPYLKLTCKDSSGLVVTQLPGGQKTYVTGIRINPGHVVLMTMYRNQDKIVTEELPLDNEWVPHEIMEALNNSKDKLKEGNAKVSEITPDANYVATVKTTDNGNITVEVSDSAAGMNSGVAIPLSGSVRGRLTPETAARVKSVRAYSFVRNKNGTWVAHLNIAYNDNSPWSDCNAEFAESDVPAAVKAKVSEHLDALADQGDNGKTLGEVKTKTDPQIDIEALWDRANKVRNRTTPVFKRVIAALCRDKANAQALDDILKLAVRNKVMDPVLNRRFGINAGTSNDDIVAKVRDYFARQEEGSPMLVTEETSREAEERRIDVNREMRALARMLPGLSREGMVAVVDGLIKLNRSGNPDAYGLFRKGLVTISRRAPSGTLFHEAFHYVSSTLLNDGERGRMYAAAKERFGDKSPMALEEDLAEDFRHYMLDETYGVARPLVRMWRKIKHVLQSFFGNETMLDSMYYGIAHGDYSSREETVAASMNLRNKINIFADARCGAFANKVERFAYGLSRTPEFRQWYGDWQLDSSLPKPNVVYATPAEYDRWDFTPRPHSPLSKPYIVHPTRKEARRADITAPYINKESGDRSTIAARAVDLMNHLTHRDIAMHHATRLMYDNLDAETQEIIDGLALDIDDYNAMSTEVKENILFCHK